MANGRIASMENKKKIKKSKKKVKVTRGKLAQTLA